MSERIGGTALPSILPIFPLTGVLLLPRGRLPLNIFEPRYLAMTRDALAGERLIGMMQPSDPRVATDNPPVYPTGCAGMARIRPRPRERRRARLRPRPAAARSQGLFPAPQDRGRLGRHHFGAGRAAGHLDRND